MSSKRGNKSLEITKVNKVGLATVLVLALAVAGNADPNQPDGAIARPSSRAATAFVPRLGKRLDRASGSLERLLCASSQECSRLALLGALVKAELNLADPSGPQAGTERWADQPTEPMREQLDGDLSILDLIAAQQHLPRRETRATDGTGELVGLGGAPGALSAKRVAFTPRIGRR